MYVHVHVQHITVHNNYVYSWERDTIVCGSYRYRWEHPGIPASHVLIYTSHNISIHILCMHYVSGCLGAYPSHPWFTMYVCTCVHIKLMYMLQHNVISPPWKKSSFPYTYDTSVCIQCGIPSGHVYHLPFHEIHREFSGVSRVRKHASWMVRPSGPSSQLGTCTQVETVWNATCPAYPYLFLKY